MTILQATIDLALLAAALAVFAAMFIAALVFRPELRKGQTLGRLFSYAVGTGILLTGILVLATWRGVAAGTGAIMTDQLWMDTIVLGVAALLATLLHRMIWGEPDDVAAAGQRPPEDVTAAIEDIKRAASDLAGRTTR